MPLDFRPVEILFRGVAQQFDDKVRPPPMLARAVNVEFDKDGALNKRRGYQFVDTGNAVNFNWPTDDRLIHLAQRRHELLVITYDNVAALGSKDEALRGVEALVYRGPNNRGHVKVRSITVSTATAEAASEDS